MTILAAIDLDAEDFELGRVLSETSTRISLTKVVPVAENVVPYFWKNRTDASDGFERSVRDHSLVADLTNLDGRVDATLYKVEWVDGVDDFFDVLRKHEIMVEGATTEHGETWHFRLRALHQRAISEFQRDCYEHRIPLTIRRVRHNPSEGSDEWSLISVTPKQREALQLAYDRGYFEVPRETSATALGEELNISRQSFSRRLQRAQQTVFSHLLDQGSL